MFEFDWGCEVGVWGVCLMSLVTEDGRRDKFYFSSHFDGGNGRVRSRASGVVVIEIDCDPLLGKWQWFHFVARVKNNTVLRIFNIEKSFFPKIWNTWKVSASVDGLRWSFRGVSIREGNIEILVTDNYVLTHWAFYMPYSARRVYALAREMSAWNNCYVGTIKSLDTPMFHFCSALKYDASKKSKKVWIIAGQHPVETNGVWVAEALIRRIARSKICEHDFFVVPMCNINGFRNGCSRSDADGNDSNRMWGVDYRIHYSKYDELIALIKENGADIFIDVHGDESSDVTYVVGCEGIPGYDEDREDKEKKFRSAFVFNHDCLSGQVVYRDFPMEGDCSIATNFIGDLTGALSLIIEVTFSYQGERVTIPHGVDSVVDAVMNAIEQNTSATSS